MTRQPGHLPTGVHHLCILSWMQFIFVKSRTAASHHLSQETAKRRLRIHDHESGFWEFPDCKTVSFLSFIWSMQPKIKLVRWLVIPFLYLICPRKSHRWRSSIRRVIADKDSVGEQSTGSKQSSLRGTSPLCEVLPSHLTIQTTKNKRLLQDFTWKYTGESFFHPKCYPSLNANTL